MKKINKNNLIVLFIVSAFVLVFSFTSPVEARSFRTSSGATMIVEQNNVASNNTNTINKTSENNTNSLTANALFGASGIIPLSLFNWFLLFLIILAIVLLTRTILGKKDKEKPLKHA